MDLHMMYPHIIVAATCMQVESRCQVRQLLPAPAAGALPLPANLDPKLLSFQPGIVEDLNSIVEEGLPRLETPKGDPRVCMGHLRFLTSACMT